MSDDAVELLALDLGDARTGLARANTKAKLPEPLPTIESKHGDWLAQLRHWVKTYDTQQLIIGLPKPPDSNKDTDQTEKIRMRAQEVGHSIGLPVTLVDEVYSTLEADSWRKRFPSADHDSLAACVILERYLRELTP